MRSFILLALLALVISPRGTRGWSACGDNDYEVQENKAAEQTVELMMKTRNPDWGWQSAKTPLALQLAAPARFFSRSKTIKAMKTRIRMEKDNMTLAELSFYALAVKAMCNNPKRFGGVNIPEIIAERMLTQFTYRNKEPKDGYYAYGYALGALCVTDYPIRRYYVNKLLAGRNEDGTFDDPSDAAHVFMALNCLASIEDPDFNLLVLKSVVRRIRRQLKDAVTEDDSGDMWIGDKDMSTVALKALFKTKRDKDHFKSWNCRGVSKSLGLEWEPEVADLSDFLLRLRGSGFTDVMDPGYECGKTDSKPKDYVPDCDPVEGADEMSCIVEGGADMK